MEKIIYEDCRNLLEYFYKLKSAKFAVFCQVWKEFQFQHIYSVQVNELEIVQTTLACMYIGKSILCNDLYPLKRIGALYLIYAIYHKQPTEKFVKIDVTLSMWREIKRFISSLDLHGDEDTDEAKLVFKKLVDGNAFKFVFLDVYCGFERFLNPYHTNSHERVNHVPIQNAFAHELNELTDDEHGFFPAMSVLEDGYNEMKEIMNKTMKEKNASVLPVTNVISDLQASFACIEKIITGKIAPESSAVTKDEVSIRTRRAGLRKKAFGADPLGDGADDEIVQVDPCSGSVLNVIPFASSHSKSYSRCGLKGMLLEEIKSELERDDAGEGGSKES